MVWFQRCNILKKAELWRQYKIGSCQGLVEKEKWIGGSQRIFRAVKLFCCCSATKLCPTLCDPMDYSTPGLSVPQHLPKFAQVHVHHICDAIQPSHLLMPSSPSALNLSQHQGLFQWVSCLPQMTTILEFQLQHQSFQRIFRVDFP